MFEVTVSGDAGQMVVEVIGDVDMLTAAPLRTALTRAVLLAGEGRTVVDLSRVRFLDSTGVQVLLDGYHSAMVAGGTLTVRGAHGTSARVLSVVGLDRLFGMVPWGNDSDGPVQPKFEQPG